MIFPSGDHTFVVCEAWGTEGCTVSALSTMQSNARQLLLILLELSVYDPRLLSCDANAKMCRSLGR